MPALGLVVNTLQAHRTLDDPFCEPRLCACIEGMEAALPRFAVRFKDESAMQRAVAVLVRPFNRDYLTRYTTVWFGRVYFPSRGWCREQGPEALYVTLRHEAVHLRDARRFPILFELSYLFALPAVFTARAWWEWRGYAETMRAIHDVGGALTDDLLDHIERQFTGASYLYMCPFPRFVRRRLERLRADITQGG